MKLKLYYDEDKAVQALNYLVQNTPGKELEKRDALKLLFLADRDHLRHGGYRTILGDQYDARMFGPVARKAYRLIERLAQNGGNRYLAVERHPGRRITIRPRRPVRMEKLSESDVKSLDCALAQLPPHSNLVAYTHRFPEWKKHEAAIKAGARSVRMDYLDFFLPCDNPADEYCDADDELVAMSKEIYEEDSQWVQ